MKRFSFLFAGFSTDDFALGELLWVAEVGRCIVWSRSGSVGGHHPEMNEEDGNYMEYFL